MEATNDTTVDMTAEMAALGLPSSFIARLDPSPSTAKKKKKSKRNPPSSSHSSGTAGTDCNKHESCTEVAELGAATHESDIPFGNFCIRSVRLYTAEKDPGLEVDGYNSLDCSRIEAETETSLSGVVYGGNVPLTYTDTVPHTVTDVLLGAVEESCDIAGNEEVRWEPVWDEQYQCYYFCNSRTWECTWDAPPGFQNYTATNSLVAVDQINTNSFVTTEENAWSVVRDEVIGCEGGRNSGSSEVRMIRGGLVEQLDDDVQESKGRFPSLGLGKAEAMPEYEEELNNGCRGETADLGEEKGGSLAESPFLPCITNSHIRFRDSDESSSFSNGEEGEDGGIDWHEIREEMAIQSMKEDAVEEDEDDGDEACSPSSQHWISSIHSNVRQHIKASKMGLKDRRLRSLSGVDQLDEVQLPGMVETMSKKLMKYWIQRYSLFTKFDEGVKMDEEGWFSVTPEIIAKHQAARCATGLVIDAFTGVGGNAIQFALKSYQVIAIDIDPIRVEYARHNAAIYGVADKIEYIVGDFFQLAPFLKADLLFLSPPWGGPEYLKQEIYDLHTMLKPKDGCTLFKVAQSIALNIALFVPRNVDVNQLQELSWLTSPPLSCEVEENYVNDKLKAITAYYGEIAGQDS